MQTVRRINFIHLRTVSNEEINFCEELFKPNQNMEALSKQLKYSSAFLPNLIFMNTNQVLEALNKEMPGYKLVGLMKLTKKIKWCSSKYREVSNWISLKKAPHFCPLTESSWSAVWRFLEFFCLNGIPYISSLHDEITM